jgi:hypothetical protein
MLPKARPFRSRGRLPAGVAPDFRRSYPKAKTEEGRMTDQELVLDALSKANLLISEYVESGPRDARKAQSTLDALIFILRDEALTNAAARLEGGQPN